MLGDARWGEVGRSQLDPDPSERCRVPPAVLLEAHVGVDLDDQQRLGRCVVDQIAGQLPEPCGVPEVGYGR